MKKRARSCYQQITTDGANEGGGREGQEIESLISADTDHRIRLGHKVFSRTGSRDSLTGHSPHNDRGLYSISQAFFTYFVINPHMPRTGVY